MTYKCLRRATAIISVIFGLAACQTIAEENSQDEEPYFFASSPIISANPQNGIILTAGLTGRLTIQNNCLVIKSAVGATLPIWPNGTPRPSNGKTLMLPEGRGGELEIGKRYKFTGASVSENWLVDNNISSPANCPRNYFIISAKGASK